MLKHYTVVLVGLLNACSTLPTSHEPLIVPLTQAVHFSSPDGSDAVVPPGVFRVERTGSTVLKLIPGEGGKQESSITVQAMPTEHEAPLSAPLALSIPYTEDEHHVVLLMPEGKALDAVGTYSGVRSRAALVPLPVKTLGPYTRLSLGLTLSSNSTVGSIPVTGGISLQPPAPGNGVIVSLSANPGLAQIPSAISIAGGQTQATFLIQPVPVVNTTPVIISASTGGITRTAPLTLVSNCPSVGGVACNNQGQCNALMGTCTCYSATVAGSACQYSNATTCNGHGTVNYTGICTCNQGFTGQYCNIPAQ